MNKLFFKKTILYFVIVLLIFLADRISKLYILNTLGEAGDVNIYFNSYINFILIWNTGVGFGLLSFEDSIIYNLITVLIIVINLIILYLIIKSDDFKIYFYLIILGGSLGNLFDRLYYSAVPDFIDISYNGYHWFIFNVADIFITLGIIFMIILEFNNKNKV